MTMLDFALPLAFENESAIDSPQGLFTTDSPQGLCALEIKTLLMERLSKESALICNQ